MFEFVDEIKIRPATKGLLTLIPGVGRLLPNRGTGGTDAAAYCYGVWLKHLTLLWANGSRSIPHTVGELGPGDSLGIGLAAILCGANTYYALDVVRYSNVATNLKILDDLVVLFKSRAARPTKGWPDFDEYLDERLFPSHILTEELLNASLSEARIRDIRQAIITPDSSSRNISIKYMVPWEDPSIIAPESVDLLLSHSVLEHVVDLEETYRALFLWLKPTGTMSHQIDFTSHGLSKTWNGYRTYPDLLWTAITGKRTYLINRQPRSVHLSLMRKVGFNIACDLALHRTDGISKAQLSKHWKDISDDDLICASAFVQAVK